MPHTGEAEIERLLCVLLLRDSPLPADADASGDVRADEVL
jgi:hypothetical protein